VDPTRFDRLVKSLARPGSRRRLLAGLAAGALGLAGLRGAEAVACRMPGELCREHADCCAKLCGPKDRSGRRRCACQTPADCPAPDQCHAVACAAGRCAASVLTGKPCDVGNACTTGTVCLADGACGGGTPVPCPARDQCHDAGVCDRTTGTCANPPKADGTACDDGDACTRTDTCQAGACVGGNPVVCTASDQCHRAGTCDPATGLCSNPPKPNGTACDDGDACTTGDTCHAGVCTAGAAKVCTALDQCQDAGTCDPQTGICSNPAKPNGTACDDGDACTTGDTCRDGTCAGGPALVCPAGQVCDHLLGCVCSTNEGCPAGYACHHGGCFLLNPSGTAQFCQDNCPGGAIANLGGQIVCLRGQAGQCASDADCIVGQACFASMFCVAPC
jgi:hypothetical protein